MSNQQPNKTAVKIIIVAILVLLASLMWFIASTNNRNQTTAAVTSQIEPTPEITTPTEQSPEEEPTAPVVEATTEEATTAEATTEPVVEEPIEPQEESPTEPVEPQEEATTASSTEPTTEPEQPKTSKVASIEEIKAVLNDESFDIIPLDTGDTVQYVQTNCNLRSGPGTNFDKIGSLQTNQEVIAHALAPTGELWCQLIDEEGNEVGYVYYDYLGDSKVQTQKKTQSQPAQAEQNPAPQEVQTEPPVQQPTNKSIAELMGLGSDAPSSFGDIPIGTPGDGSEANGMFVNAE